MIKIPVDLHNLLLHLGRMQGFFETRKILRGHDTTDTSFDVAHNDLNAIAGIIETGVKNIDPCDLKKP